MESLGRFAGGIAHDFNNLITVIRGNCEIMGMDRTSPYTENVDQISSSAKRAADLVAILSFSRPTMQDPGPIHLNDLLGDFKELIRRIIGKNIDVSILFSPDDPVIYGDAGQIEQVLMNLGANARDAMPAGGTLTIGLHSIISGQANGDVLPGLPEGK